MPHSTSFDFLKLGQALYNIQIIFFFVTGIVLWFLRTKIGRIFRRAALALKRSTAQSAVIDGLMAKLRDSEQARIDWQSRFDELEARYEALGTEYRRLGVDIQAIRQRMTTAEELALMLHADRDALITHTRLLVGQLYANQLKPDYPTPSLKSMVAVPGPPRPEDDFKL